MRSSPEQGLLERASEQERRARAVHARAQIVAGSLVLKQNVTHHEYRTAGNVLVTDHPVTFPGIAIMVSVLGINLLSEGLRSLSDPRQRR